MLNKSLKSSLVLLMLAFGIASANAATDVISFSDNLSINQEAGSINTPINASGVGQFTYNKRTHVLHFAITYSNLSGAPFKAHFHKGPIHVNGPVQQTICGEPSPALLSQCPATANGQLVYTWNVPKDDRAPLLAGQIFVNVHTQLNKNGEIRAQLTPTQ